MIYVCFVSANYSTDKSDTESEISSSSTSDDDIPDIIPWFVKSCLCIINIPYLLMHHHFVGCGRRSCMSCLRRKNQPMKVFPQLFFLGISNI